MPSATLMSFSILLLPLLDYYGNDLQGLQSLVARPDLQSQLSSRASDWQLTRPPGVPPGGLHHFKNLRSTLIDNRMMDE